MLKVSLISAIVSIIILGLVGSSLQSYAGNGSDLNPPNYVGDDCSVGYVYFETDIISELLRGGTCSAGPLSGTSSIFCEGTQPGAPTPKVCVLEVPNFIDPFDTKLIRIQGTYTGTIAPSGVSVDGLGAICQQVNREDPFLGYFFEDWICRPNPDQEQIVIGLETETFLTQVIVDTVSFDTPVGGKLLSLDTTSLIIAGSKTTAAWLIPVIVAGIGFAIVITRKF